MKVEVVNRQRRSAIDRKLYSQFAEKALSELAAVSAASGDSSLTVAFVRDGQIRKLNRDFRGKDKPTDVLSFPSGSPGDDELLEESEESYLGDVVISTDTASRQAEEAGHTFDVEVRELILHGVLHLCGYDHETDRGEMKRLELRLRRKLMEK